MELTPQEQRFISRLSQLRLQKGVSARDMSLSLGQSHAYINMIENGNMLPSLAAFFYICEYLDITPGTFFDDTIENPKELEEIIANLKRLNYSQRRAVGIIIQEFCRKREEL